MLRSELRCVVFLLFMRRFWNQIFTCRSDRLRLRANSHRFCFETYALNKNSFSSSKVWNFEYGLRFLRTETWWLLVDCVLLPFVQSIRSSPLAAAAFVANRAAWWCNTAAAWWWWTNASSGLNERERKKKQIRQTSDCIDYNEVHHLKPNTCSLLQTKWKKPKSIFLDKLCMCLSTITETFRNLSPIDWRVFQCWGR